MITIIESTDFANWMSSLRDITAKSKILTRIRRFKEGNPGDYKSVGGGVSELRITYGPGYRVYYTFQGIDLVLLLVGGDKSSQRKDIEKALLMAKALGGHYGN